MSYFPRSLLRNQIQGETLPRLSQAGESFPPEFDFREKIAPDGADVLRRSRGATRVEPPPFLLAGQRVGVASRASEHTG